jgi:hypothetical protein
MTRHPKRYYGTTGICSNLAIIINSRLESGSEGYVTAEEEPDDMLD